MTGEPATPEKPVEEVALTPVAQEKSADTERKGDALTPAPLPGAPRGTIRGRWGTRGRYRPAGAPPPIFEGQKSARGQGAAVEGVREAADLAQAETESRPAAVESSEPSTEAAQQAPTYAESKVGAADSETIEPVAAPMNGGDAPSAPAAESLDSALVNHLTGYSGVGQRTAESLVEAFGADVFRVMDEEPERVREILPDHRAERVLEERRRELSAGRE